MKVTYIGHSCFQIKFSTGLSVCFDPYSHGSVPGLSDAEAVADMTFCSHSHADHNDSESVGTPDEPYTGPAPEVKVIGTYHDEVKGAERGLNNITLVKSGDETVVHMGDIGCDLPQEQLSLIKGCDLLMIPVGGFFTIDCGMAYEMCRKTDSKAVIPMHYRGASFGYSQISGREEFVELITKEGVRKMIASGSEISGLPEEKSLILMEPLRSGI